MTALAELFARDLTRLLQEVQAFAGHDALLWETGGRAANSCGNLALHLEGNLREYVGRQLGGHAYTRQRDREFADRGLTVDELAARLRDLPQLIPGVVAGLPPGASEQVYPQNVLGRPLSTGQFLLHIYGHLNYHLGQMDYLRRAMLGQPALALAALPATEKP